MTPVDSAVDNSSTTETNSETKRGNVTTAPLQLFDALPSHIEDALRASIDRFGVLVPVVKDQHGRIIDGHHRSRIADQLSVKYRVDVLQVSDEDEAREIALTLNSDRRHLNEDQRKEIVRVLREQGHSLRAIAGALGTSKDTVARDLEIVSPETIPDRVVRQGGGSYPAKRPTIVAAKNEKEAERAQEALALVPESTGRVYDIKRIERIARETAAELKRAEPIETVTVNADIDIRHGDFRTILADIEPGTVDAIITDPPYPAQFWQQYSEHNVYEPLGALARVLLKKNGVLAVMVGTRLEMLDAVDEQLGKHMRRRCRAVYLTPGQRWRDNLERVAVGYKPVLIYAHPDANNNDLQWINSDVFTSTGTNEADQRFHHWGQNEQGFAEIVDRLTQIGQLVVDPFLGGGTTGIVCRDLKRCFIGCDIDAAAVATTRERLT